MNRDQKLQFNQQVRRSGMLVARFLKSIWELPQEIIDLILRDLKNTLRVIPLRSLTLNLPINLEQQTLATSSPYRSFNVYFSGMRFRTPLHLSDRDTWTDDPPKRANNGSNLGRLGYGSFQ